MAQKPSIPKGTRDFSPEEMAKRNFIFDTIIKEFQLYGYQQIETPAIENLSTLLGKYGDEGDKLLFKILNSGDYLSGLSDQVLKQKDSSTILKHISEKGLRFDLTVPFARYVVQHRNDITFPFKRYQIQPVWRADRPQKGRYREFFQCDVDVVGSNSLLSEAELVQIADKIFTALGVDVEIKLNNRKILAGLSELIGEKEKIVDITVAIDKLDKISMDEVIGELQSKGISAAAIDKLQPILKLSGTFEEKINQLEQLLASSETGRTGLEEIKTIFDYLSVLPVKSPVELDITLARGLDYYTGAIIEVKSKDVAIGSVCGGGRYDDLTGIFGLPGVSGVGISFGADRIYDVMEEKNLFPETITATTQLLFVNFGPAEEKYCLPVINQLRDKGINAELFPDSVKMKKQLTYANRKGIPYVAIVGEEEMKAGRITLKNMKTGEQKRVSASELAVLIK